MIITQKPIRRGLARVCAPIGSKRLTGSFHFKPWPQKFSVWSARNGSPKIKVWVGLVGIFFSGCGQGSPIAACGFPQFGRKRFIRALLGDRCIELYVSRQQAAEHTVFGKCPGKGNEHSQQSGFVFRSQALSSTLSGITSVDGEIYLTRATSVASIFRDLAQGRSSIAEIEGARKVTFRSARPGICDFQIGWSLKLDFDVWQRPGMPATAFIT